MKTLLVALFLFCAGFTAGGYVYSKMFDPIEFLHRSHENSKFAYEAGCFDAFKHQHVDDFIPTDEERKWCHQQAEEFYQNLVRSYE